MAAKPGSSKTLSRIVELIDIAAHLQQTFTGQVYSREARAEMFPDSRVPEMRRAKRLRSKRRVLIRVGARSAHSLPRFFRHS